MCPGTCTENPPNTEFAYVISEILPSAADVWEQDELRLEDEDPTLVCHMETLWCEEI